MQSEHVETEVAIPVGYLLKDGFKKPMDIHSIIKGRLHLRMAILAIIPTTSLLGQVRISKVDMQAPEIFLRSFNSVTSINS